MSAMWKEVPKNTYFVWKRFVSFFLKYIYETPVEQNVVQQNTKLGPTGPEQHISWHLLHPRGSVSFSLTITVLDDGSNHMILKPLSGNPYPTQLCLTIPHTLSLSLCQCNDSAPLHYCQEHINWLHWEHCGHCQTLFTLVFSGRICLGGVLICHAIQKNGTSTWSWITGDHAS